MPSVVSGYEYDIFISYRHKDNKGEHWVSEFVTALRTELESTFKEDISIYFDENPHDGLLETHDVAKSLQGKLKCLVFIPIISQTYCDPKSYAWQHEFCAFNKMVTEGDDTFGRDIRLKNGNVASRILPVKIHDLDPDDKQLIESELGSVLRGVEFIYKSAGVNRPLRLQDDKSENQNHTSYRDQINKVANAIKDIISGIQNKANPNVTGAASSKVDHATRKVSKTSVKRNAVVALLTLIALVLGYSVFQYSSARISASTVEKSIVVLPFKNVGPDDSDEYFSKGMTIEVTSYLSKVSELKVLSSTSVEKYTQQNADKRAIGEDLNVSYLLEGTVRKSGKTFRINVQLVEAETGYHVWTNEYDKEMTDVLEVQSEIAREVTDALKIVLTDEERKIIQSKEAVELTAYDFYLKARNELMNYHIDGPIKGLPRANKAIEMFYKAIEADPTFARAYTGLGVVLCEKGDRNAFIEKDFLDSAKRLADKAISLDKNIDEAYFILGLYYNQKADDDKAIEQFKRALQINPNYADAMFSLGLIYANFKEDFVTGLSLMQKALQLGRGPEIARRFRMVGLSYEFLGLFDKTAEYQSSAMEIDGDSTITLTSMSWRARTNGNYEEALKLANRALQANPTEFFASDDRAWALTLMGQYEEALKERLRWKSAVTSALDLPLPSALPANRLGHLYWMLGDKKTAMKYFHDFIAFGEQSIHEEQVSAREGYSTYDLAGVHAFLGEKEKAYHYLDMINKKRFIPAFILDVMSHDPMFDKIRDEERFKKIQKDLVEKNKRERDRVQNWLDKESMKTKLSPKL
jgi:TolB-like protein/Flp pilus assembly protein TadD